MHSNANRLLSIGLRFLTLGARFVFIFFLAKLLNASEVGYYGLFTATAFYAMSLIGLDFYTFSTREIINTPNEERGRLLKGHIALTCAVYIVLLPIGVYLLIHSGWPSNLIWWFVPILLLEHLNQEIFRLLVALSEQVSATFILFVRQGSWAIVSVITLYALPASRHLDTVMATWFIAGVCAAYLGYAKIMRLQMGGWTHPIDWRWIKRGITVSAWLLVASLSLRGIQTFDRYWLEALGGIENYIYPQLIKHHDRREFSEAARKVRIMLLQTVIFSIVFAIISIALLPYLLAWIDNPQYANATEIYPLLLLALVLNALGMVPHYALYAKRKDNSIVLSQIFALLVFILSTWGLSHYIGTMAIPMSLCIAFAVPLFWKSYAYLRTKDDLVI